MLVWPPSQDTGVSVCFHLGSPDGRDVIGGFGGHLGITLSPERAGVSPTDHTRRTPAHKIQWLIPGAGSPETWGLRQGAAGWRWGRHRPLHGLPQWELVNVRSQICRKMFKTNYTRGCLLDYVDTAW